MEWLSEERGNKARASKVLSFLNKTCDPLFPNTFGIHL